MSVTSLESVSVLVNKIAWMLAALFTFVVWYKKMYVYSHVDLTLSHVDLTLRTETDASLNATNNLLNVISFSGFCCMKLFINKYNIIYSVNQFQLLQVVLSSAVVTGCKLKNDYKCRHVFGIRSCGTVKINLLCAFATGYWMRRRRTNSFICSDN